MNISLPLLENSEPECCVEKTDRTLVEACSNKLSDSKLHYHFGLNRCNRMLFSDRSITYRLMGKTASFLKDKRRQIMKTLTRPPRQNVVQQQRKTVRHKHGWNFSLSLLEEYYNPAHGHAEDNNNDHAE
ncbi:hypothetical protein Tco_0088305 [Tanacetum coccineum]